MKMVKSLPLIIAACFVSGCSPMAMMSPDSLSKQHDMDLCREYGSSRLGKIKAELERRNSLTAIEWELVNRKQIKVGMSELALMCSWGFPGGWGRVHETTTRHGESVQYVYRSCRSCSATYVYTSDGKVSAWQD